MVWDIERETPFLKPGKILSDEYFQDTGVSLSDFELVKSSQSSLGKGAYGEVKLVKFKKTQDYYALKIINWGSSANKNIDLMREVEIHKRLKHDNIVRLLQYFEDGDKLCLILEYASKGSLFHAIRKRKFLEEDEAFYFFV